MNETHKKNGREIFSLIIDFIRGGTPEEEGWEKTSAIIYEIMNFIFRHKDLTTRRFDREFFCASLKKELFSCEEAIKFGIEQNWIEETEGKIAVTDDGFSYEDRFWREFR